MDLYRIPKIVDLTGTVEDLAHVANSMRRRAGVAEQSGDHTLAVAMENFALALEITTTDISEHITKIKEALR